MNELLFQSEEPERCESSAELNDNRVKIRKDGAGDAWADQHRTSTPSGCFMQDVDISFGCQVFGHNTGERLFMEFQPDGWENRGRRIRKFGVVALFDRKSSVSAAFHGRNDLSTAFYLYQCRAFSRVQPVAPKLFYIIGGQEPPWTMIELDINHGAECGKRVELGVARWDTLWVALGLFAMRAELVHWLNTCGD